jgi:uncharacterized protein (TIGR02594 family)
MIPKEYDWLRLEAGPKVLGAALADIGLTEIPGTKSNPQILAMAKELGLQDEYRNDDTPWCGLAVAYWVKKAGYTPIHKPLWALNWVKWGNEAKTPSLGDVMVFRRKVAGGWAGHVAVYIAETATHYVCLGGNQNNQVCISSTPKTSFVAARRPPFKIGQPANVRPIRLSKSGAPITSQA